MKFYPLTGESAPGTELKAEYENARAIGSVRIGAQRLYLRQGRKIGHISYADIRRCYRRVLVVPMRMCCGKGDMELENLVVEGDEGELATVRLPGGRAAKAVMEELGKKLPEAYLGCPKKAAASEA